MREPVAMRLYPPWRLYPELELLLTLLRGQGSIGYVGEFAAAGNPASTRKPDDFATGVQDNRVILAQSETAYAQGS